MALSCRAGEPLETFTGGLGRRREQQAQIELSVKVRLKSCPACPTQSLWEVLREASCSRYVTPAQAELRFGETPLSRTAEPLDRRRLVGGNAAPIDEHEPEGELCARVALLCRRPIPANGDLLVLADTAPVLIETA